MKVSIPDIVNACSPCFKDSKKWAEPGCSLSVHTASQDAEGERFSEENFESGALRGLAGDRQKEPVGKRLSLIFFFYHLAR